MEKEPHSTETREFIEHKVVRVSSKEEATELVKEFWSAMPHGKQLLEEVTQNLGDDWTQELTQGDRTRIVEGKRFPPEDRGKWLVHFRGNHQPLSQEATQWLKDKDLL